MPTSDQPGLRLRLAQEARRIAGQHQYLDALEARTLHRLERGGAGEMAEAVRSFEAALLAHFGLEEQVQFPALHGLDADLTPDLTELVRAHARFRKDLDELRELVRDAGPDAQRPQILSRFGRLAAELRDHEEREEKLLAEASRNA